jgi:hypothetical protein
LPFLFKFAVEYAIRVVQVYQDGLKLNCTRQFLDYADDDNILGGNIHTIVRNTEALVFASKEIGLELNAEKIFGPVRDEVTAEQRKLHNEELNDLYSLPHIIWVTKAKRMR